MLTFGTELTYPSPAPQLLHDYRVLWKKTCKSRKEEKSVGIMERTSCLVLNQHPKGMFYRHFMHVWAYSLYDTVISDLPS